MNIKELDLLEKQEMRNKVINRTEVLDKVKDLLLLPNTEYATTEQVANYYEVNTSSMWKQVERNKDELISDGYRVWKANDFKTDKLSELKVATRRGSFDVEFSNGEVERFSPRGVGLFPKRAILRVGMLLRDSKVAKEVRTRLLDVVHDTQESSPKITNNIISEMTEEQKIYLKLGQAVNDRDIEGILIANAELNGLKNKRIAELENINKNITTNALTITESRSVINRIVRTIAFQDYNGMCGVAWSDLYSKLNYKLGINVKARKKNKSESYINTLTEEEIYETEKIVRNWAVEVGLDLDKLLKIA